MITSTKNRDIQSILKALLLPKVEKTFESIQQEQKILGLYENKVKQNVSRLCN